MMQVWNEKGSAKIRWLEGAVRSAKTFLANDIAIYEIQRLPACNVLISGFSIATAARNVVSAWKESIDPADTYGYFRTVKDDKDEYLIIDWRGLRGKRFYIRGAGTERDFKQIQGGTFGYWYGDEMTRHHKSFVEMAISRLSPPFAKALGTLNPDNPYHYIKKDYLDNPLLFQKKVSGIGMASLFAKWSFQLDDNPSLTPEYKEMLRNTYSGVFYRRYVLGEWAVAEGLIYDSFNKDKHVLTGECPPAKYYTVAIDYGTGNPTCFILFGHNEESTPKVWAEREYFYDSKAAQRQKSDAEYSKDLKKFLDGIQPRHIIIDPSAASFKVQLQNDHFFFIKDADNSVIDGIRTQLRMLNNGEYAVHVSCKKTIEDYAGYAWNDRARQKGEDEPLKTNGADHTKDVERYDLHTLYGKRVKDYDKFNEL
jgi:PBSX family phage terminase large subunit